MMLPFTLKIKTGKRSKKTHSHSQVPGRYVPSAEKALCFICTERKHIANNPKDTHEHILRLICLNRTQPEYGAFRF